VTALGVDEGDVIRIHTGNGAGYGRPDRRRRELVLEDLRNGYVSEEIAAGVYRLPAAGKRRSAPPRRDRST
jgi:N-methylhydantoinase B